MLLLLPVPPRQDFRLQWASSGDNPTLPATPGLTRAVLAGSHQVGLGCGDQVLEPVEPCGSKGGMGKGVLSLGPCVIAVHFADKHSLSADCGLMTWKDIHRPALT